MSVCEPGYGRSPTAFTERAPTCDRGGDTRARNPETLSTPRAPWTDPGMTERAQHPRRECPPPAKNTVEISDPRRSWGGNVSGAGGLAARSRDPKASVRVGAPSDTGQILRGTPRPRGARRSPTCGSVSRRRRIAWRGRNFLARASPRTCGTSPARLPFPSSRDPAWWPVGCQGGKSGLTSARLRFCDPFTSRRDSQSAPPSEPPFLALPINRMRGSLQLTKRNEGIFFG